MGLHVITFQCQSSFSLPLFLAVEMMKGWRRFVGLNSSKLGSCQGTLGLSHHPAAEENALLVSATSPYGVL